MQELKYVIAEMWANRSNVHSPECFAHLENAHSMIREEKKAHM